MATLAKTKEMGHLRHVPDFLRSPHRKLSSAFNERYDVIGTKAELAEVRDPLGLQRFRVGVGGSLQFAAGDVTSDDEPIPRSPC